MSRRVEDFFSGAAGKILSAVEADAKQSNQHEFNGVAALATLLGEPPVGVKRRFQTAYVFLDDDMEPLVVDSTATWYDARDRHPKRSEFRLYYPHNEVMARAFAGDYMVIARVGERSVDARELVVVVAPAASTVAAQLQMLFGLEPSERFDLETLPSGEDLSYTARELLEALGFEATPSQENYLEQLLARFGTSFPATAAFSAFARSTVPQVDPSEDPDRALLAWMDQEESLYRTLERHVVGTLLAEAEGDVDHVLTIAMKTFQRRRSRAGHALENHVGEVLSAWGIAFDSQARTEGRIRPDFLMPGFTEYHDPTFPAASLRMLAVKTSCKDRWRQVLAEAARIPVKHLLTLEAPISVTQTDEMQAASVVLVVPQPLHAGFSPAQSVSSVRAMLVDFGGRGRHDTRRVLL